MPLNKKHTRYAFLISLIIIMVMIVSLGFSFNHAKRQLYDSMSFQNALLEKSFTRTLQSVESSVVSVRNSFEREFHNNESDEFNLSVSLTLDIQSILAFSSHIRQIIITHNDEIVFDSSGRSTGENFNFSVINFDTSNAFKATSGLDFLSKVNGRFLPVSTNDTAHQHSMLVTGLKGHSDKDNYFWVIFALNPNYFDDIFLNKDNGNFKFPIGFTVHDILNNNLHSVSCSPCSNKPLNQFIDSGYNTALIGYKSAAHSLIQSTRYPIIVSLSISYADILKTWFFNNIGMFIMLILFAFAQVVLAFLLLKEFNKRTLIQDEVNLLAKAIDNANTSIILTDPEQRITYANPFTFSLFGFSLDFLLGKNPKVLSSGKTDISVMDDLRNSIDLGYDWQGELINRNSHGDDIHVDTKVASIKDDNGNVTHYIGIMNDVTERKSFLKQLEEKNLKLSQLATVFSHAQEAIMLCSCDGKILDVNTSFTKITGYEANEVIGKTPRILNSGYHSASFYNQMWASIINDGHWHGEIRNRRKNGEIFVEYLTITTVRDESNNVLHYVSMFTDITIEKTQEEKLKYLAYYDLLTGLPNRRLLMDRLEKSISQCDRHKRLMCLAFIDLDGFKQVNDSFGHNEGDNLLIFISKELSSNLRDSDTLARFGGDEFVALITDFNDLNDIHIILDRMITSSTSDFYTKDLTKINVSASIGATVYPQVEQGDVKKLLHQADQAMYKAKSSGKNKYVIYQHGDNVVSR
ncbi:bifunctional diguanylate cyclase/phosphodiesterase [Nitrincola schmidtii]|uniref:sensor domain-containing protein n=1 Tax=Nitrincola schmidtii TaxID=1730894 RepID=UPI00124F292D|nr:diguanylate cyclase [Nitrincola schmidtii]